MIQEFHPWVYIKENENTNSKRLMHPNVHTSIIYKSQETEALFTRAKIMKQTKCPSTEEWIKKMWYIYIYIYIYIHTHWNITWPQK